MKNRLQFVAIILLALLLISLVVYIQGYLGGRLLGTVNIIFTLMVLVVGMIIFFENRQPSNTITWLIVLASFPIVGFIFYMIFGQSYRKRRLFRKRTFTDAGMFSEFEKEQPVKWHEQLEKMGDQQQLLFRLARRFDKTPISFSTETKVLTNGEETFDAIIEAMKKAKYHIHLEYYIVRHDSTGKKIQDVLIEKAKEGVEVRFLYDSVGSWLLSKAYIRQLREAGVKMIPFFPVKLPFLNHKINFRNHRKIVVIDGDAGFIGGLNIGDEYLGMNRNFGFWRDTHLFVKGEAVRSLQLIFLRDWYYMTGETLLEPGYLSPVHVEKENPGGVQMIASGPDDEWEVIKSLFFSMIVSAKQSIWIASPYFIPDEDILSALKVAALSGIEVRLLVPNRPDKRIVFYASRSYFPELLEAGVKIYEYQNGFMHSKIIIVDNEFASIGTSNMDMRSFHLNFEVNAFLYKTESTNELVDDYLKDMKDSKQIFIDQFKKRSLLSRVVESTSRLLSPLL
jgi:cardiolipin synthase